MELSVLAIQQKDPAPHEWYYTPDAFYRSIGRFGVEAVRIGYGEHWGGLGDKAKKLKKVLDENGVRTPYMIYTDTFDVMFTVHPNEVLEAFKDHQTNNGGIPSIMFGAEKHCFSDITLAPLHPPCDTAYKYLNSGWCIGETEAFHEALRQMDPDHTILDDHQDADQVWHHDNDQVHWQLQMIHGTVPIGLDHDAELVWCMSAVEEAEVEMKDGKVKCLETGTTPLVLHLNGGAKNIWGERLRNHLGL